MTKQEFETEFRERIQGKKAGICREDCPWSDAEFDAYREGYNAAFMWAEDILHKMLAETVGVWVDAPKELTPDFVQHFDNC